ncbi:MAG: alpha/beta hydrolase [Burkholderiales bacterium]
MTDAGTVALDVDGRALAVEYAWIAAADPHAPLVVFLHEGLGSASMWKDYPQALCAALRMRGLVYSRPGYGWSTPRAAGERWPVDFLHRQAHDVLPRLLAQLGVTDAPWLFGHSDGASIALLHAAAFPASTAGVVAVAPHIFVEDVSVRSIEAARATYRTGDLRARLARYHDDPDSAFYGWNDAWLDPQFRAFNIERELTAIRCPVLAVQGYDDEYGTMAQVDDLARHVAQAKVVRLRDCGHSPHRDQPAALSAAVVAFVADVRATTTPRSIEGARAW